MNKLDKIEMMGKDLIKYYCPNYYFVWDRSKRRKGQCRYSVEQIGLSKPLAELNSIECMLLTVIHEIAHALTKGHHHDKTWQDKCLELGGDGRKYYDANNTVTPRKWVLWCNGSPTSIKRFRRFKTLSSALQNYTWKRETNLINGGN